MGGTRLERSRWYRPTAFGLTLAVSASFGALTIVRFGAFDAKGLVGWDLTAYLEFARRFLDTGSMYLPSQISGAYIGQPYWLPTAELPSLYPPHAVGLFVPFLFLPGLLWWLIPMGSVAAAITYWRPAPWSWPLVALLSLNVDTTSGVIVGNTMMWLVAFVAGGLMFGWPAVLITIKPSVIPFAILGIRDRRWWAAALIAAAVSAMMIPEWLRYGTALQNAQTTLAYSLDSVPVMLMPVIAWLARTREAPHRPS
jgi:hypothetical protein